jgi:hypothetical protein
MLRRTRSTQPGFEFDADGPPVEAGGLDDGGPDPAHGVAELARFGRFGDDRPNRERSGV